MNSMFSCFDALFAEILGMKTRTILPPLAANPSSGNGSGSTSTVPQQVVSDDSMGNRGKNSRGLVMEPRLSSRPRLAPELDGLYCFETIVCNNSRGLIMEPRRRTGPHLALTLAPELDGLHCFETIVLH